MFSFDATAATVSYPTLKLLGCQASQRLAQAECPGLTVAPPALLDALHTESGFSNYPQANDQHDLRTELGYRYSAVRHGLIQSRTYRRLKLSATLC